MSKRICPACGKEIPAYRTLCNCGYHETVNDEELWKRIDAFNRSGKNFVVLALIGILVFVVGVLVAIFGDGNVVPALIGVGGALVAFIGFSRAEKQRVCMNLLINDEMGEFIRTAFTETVGPDRILTKDECREFNKKVAASNLIQGWNGYRADKESEQSYKGVTFTIANLELRYHESGTDEDTGVDRRVFYGPWVILKQKEAVREPFCIRCIKDKKDVYYQLNDGAEPSLNVEPFVDYMRELGEAVQGKVHLAFVDDEIHVAMDTTVYQYRVMNAVNAAGVKNVKTLKDAIKDETMDQAHYLDEVLRIPADLV